jgi:hypothetical protein
VEHPRLKRQDKGGFIVPRGTKAVAEVSLTCSTWNMNNVGKGAAKTFHVERMAQIPQAVRVPRETSCILYAILLTFRELRGPVGAHYRGRKSKRRGWKDNHRSKPGGMPRCL